MSKMFSFRILEKLPVHEETFGGYFEILVGFREGGILGQPDLKRVSALIHMEDDLLTSITGEPTTSDFRTWSLQELRRASTSTPSTTT